jgi:hypothetical protein
VRVGPASVAFGPLAAVAEKTTDHLPAGKVLDPRYTPLAAVPDTSRSITLLPATLAITLSGAQLLVL